MNSNAPPDAGPAGLQTGLVRLLRTASFVTLITGFGSLLGLIRDLSIARFFGASGQTDAFLVAWTIPETATPLLMEGAVAFLLVPLFAREAELRGSPSRAVRRTLLPALALLTALTALIAGLAPVLVRALAPGLSDPSLAIRCFRVASVTIFLLGTSGYLMAALRATGVFLVPAWVYTAYNVGVLAMILPFHRRAGVFIAAVGLVVGSVGMVLVQIGPFLRRVSLRHLTCRADRQLLAGLVAFLPLSVYTLGRQGQVYVERFLGSDLGIGAISHLNYASKVAQIPMQIATTVALVSFPSLARHAAAGRTDALRFEVERNLRLGTLFILPATAFLVAFARPTLTLLFQHGAFTPQDTAATAAVMRIYSLGLLGQTLVAIATLCFFSMARTTWYPACAAIFGLAATVLVGWAGAMTVGVPGIAAGNAAGITLMAVILIAGIRDRVTAIDRAGIIKVMLSAALAAGIAGLFGYVLDSTAGADLPILLVLLLGVLGVTTAYVIVGAALRIEELVRGWRWLAGRLRRQGTVRD